MKKEDALKKAQESHVALEQISRINTSLPKNKAKRFDAIYETKQAEHSVNLFNLRKSK